MDTKLGAVKGNLKKNLKVVSLANSIKNNSNGNAYNTSGAPSLNNSIELMSSFGSQDSMSRRIENKRYGHVTGQIGEQEELEYWEKLGLASNLFNGVSSKTSSGACGLEFEDMIKRGYIIDDSANPSSRTKGQAPQTSKTEIRGGNPGVFTSMPKPFGNSVMPSMTNSTISIEDSWMLKTSGKGVTNAAGSATGTSSVIPASYMPT